MTYILSTSDLHTERTIAADFGVLADRVRGSFALTKEQWGIARKYLRLATFNAALSILMWGSMVISLDAFIERSQILTLFTATH